MLIIRFIHYLGISMWLGGGITAVLLVASADRESPMVQASLYRRLAALHTRVIAIGALFTIGSGILWSMSLVSASGVEGGQMPFAYWVMVLTGFVGGVLVFFAALPNSARLARLAVPGDGGKLPPACKRYQSRLSTTSALASALAVVSLLASVAAT